ncbi:response regulator [Bacteriovoracaceae bacterium]|nr:response regulator [Bacteriovoracaceae bacterium]
MEKQLLVVEDDLDLCQILREEITERKPDYKLIFAHTEAGAKKALEANEITHILCDIRLPNSSGVDFARHTQRENHKIKIILMSGFPDERELAPGKILGVSHIFSKPFDYDELVQAIDGEDGNAEEYFQLHIDFVNNYIVYPFDIFVRLNASKYLKIFPKDQQREGDNIDKFYSQGIKYLWVKKTDYLAINEQLFVPVRRNLLSVNKPIPFALYEYKEFNFKVFLDEKALFTKEHKEVCKKRELKTLYIRDCDNDKLLSYLDKSIEEILRDSETGEDEKAGQLNDYALTRIESAFFNPTAQEIQDLAKIQKNMTQFFASSKTAINSFFEEVQEEKGLYQHSINVSALTWGLFLQIEKDREENPKTAFKDVTFSNNDTKEILCMAGLLHDLGEISLKTQALEDPEKITEAYIKEKHPHEAANLLREMNDIDAKLIEVVQNHEEFCDRSGKMKKNRSQLSLFAQMISLTNYYDELVTLKDLTKGQALMNVKENENKFYKKLIPLLEKLVQQNHSL